MSVSPGPTPTAKVAIRWQLNLALLVFFVAVHLLSLFLVPLLNWQGWLGALPLILMALITTPMWALAHEGIHGQLHPDKAWNLRLGRALGWFFGSPFRLLRHGHLHHHRHSRMEEDRTEIYDARSQSAWVAALAFYPRLLCGLYLGELIANFLFWLPRSVLVKLLDQMHPGGDAGPARQRAEKELLSPEHLAEMRRDGLTTILLYAIAFWLYGSLWWQLALVLLVRSLLISLVDNSFHYGTPLQDHLYSLNLRLPRWAAPLILNFNMHRTHHRHVSLPWHALPSATRYEAEDPPFFWGLARQLGGPISLEKAQQLALPEHWQR